MIPRLCSTVAWAAFITAIACTSVLRADLPRVSLADIDKTDLGKGWSDVKADGDVKCREAARGGMATFSVKAWWDGEALRPPENTRYVLEIRYKDTAATPVICSTFGGLDRYHGPTEVHRFGGAGDGRWKTAAVAVGWDQILRQGDKVTFGLTPSAALPVAEVKFRPAATEDVERHNAETRAWVARVQAEKRKAAPLEIKPRQFLAGKAPAPGPIAFAWPSLVPLLQNAQPRDDQIGAPIKIRMCLNELEGGSFGVYANDQALTGVNYAVSDLAGPSGRLRADVVPRTAEYALVPRGKSGYTWFPQRLWPACRVDIPRGQSHWFLFNLRTHRGQARPGLYRGTVAIAADQGRAALPVEVEVLPVDLLTMDEARLFMGGCVTGLVPVHDIEFAVDYNQNGINLWYSGIHPKAEIRGDKLALDFSILDEWMAAAKKRGLAGNVWFLGGNPYGFPNTMHLFRHMASIDTRDGHQPLVGDAWIKAQSAGENRGKPMARERELAVEWVRQATAHARQMNWPEVILTPFDEPAKWVQNKAEGRFLGTGPWIRTYFDDGCAVIREGSKDVRIYASIHHVDRTGKKEGLVFMDDIDIFCTNAIHEDPKVGDKVRAAGKTFWQYSGGDFPDQARFGYGFYFASFGSTGSLRWAYNWGPGFDTTEGGENWMYAWHTPFDTIPSPSYEGMREAWDDRRIIETYRKKFSGDAEAMAALAAIFKEASASRAEGGRDTVGDFWTAVDDVSKMDRWRNQLLDRLAKAR